MFHGHMRMKTSILNRKGDIMTYINDDKEKFEEIICLDVVSVEAITPILEKLKKDGLILSYYEFDGYMYGT